MLKNPPLNASNDTHANSTFPQDWEIYFAILGKLCIFAVDFRRKSPKRYTSILVDRNVGTFYSEKQERCDGLRVLAWTVSHFCFSRYSDNLYPKKWCIWCHALYFLVCCGTGKREEQRTKNGFRMFYRCGRSLNSRLHCAYNRLSYCEFLHDKQKITQD